MKNTFAKLINQATKDFYAISGLMDEMRQQESYRFSNTILMFIFPILMIGNTVALLLSLRHPEKVGTLLALANILFLGFIQILASHLALKTGISQSYEDEVDFTLLKKSLIKSSRGVFFSAFLGQATSPAFYKEWSIFIEELTDPAFILGRLIISVIIALIYYHYTKKQLQKKILSNH